MRSIPQKGRAEYLRQQLNQTRSSDNALYWEISKALLYVQMHETARTFWELDRPLCEHGLRHCPICHVEKPYNPAWDHEAPAVQ